MRIVCAPDSFKGTLTAREATEAMRRGIQRVHPDAEVDLCPIADGGEGTMQALVDATGGAVHAHEVQDPLGRPVEACFGELGDGSQTAVVEMASASGLTRLAESERDPMRTSTFGTGQLLAHALDTGARRILLAIGGSATNDGGCGAAQALGFRFLDASGDAIGSPIGGGDLLRIHAIEVSEADQRLAHLTIRLCCDVDNPLTGPDGAAAVYGPQKGASEDLVEVLDAGLMHIARLWRDELGHDVDRIPGAGAAGGMGGGMIAMLGAELQRGIDVVLDAVRFRERIQGADLCLTGEGRFDAQSLHGKACFGVADVARRHGVPTIAIVGSIGEDAPDEMTRRARGITAIHDLVTGTTEEIARREAARLVEERVAGALRD